MPEGSSASLLRRAAGKVDAVRAGSRRRSAAVGWLGVRGAIAARTARRGNPSRRGRRCSAWRCGRRAVRPTAMRRSGRRAATSGLSASSSEGPWTSKRNETQRSRPISAAWRAARNGSSGSASTPKGGRRAGPGHGDQVRVQPEPVAVEGAVGGQHREELPVGLQRPPPPRPARPPARARAPRRRRRRRSPGPRRRRRGAPAWPRPAPAPRLTGRAPGVGVEPAGQPHRAEPRELHRDHLVAVDRGGGPGPAEAGEERARRHAWARGGGDRPLNYHTPRSILRLARGAEFG